MELGNIFPFNRGRGSFNRLDKCGGWRYHSSKKEGNTARLCLRAAAVFLPNCAVLPEHLSAARDGAENREPGVNPGRYRHCQCGGGAPGGMAPAIGAIREGGASFGDA